MNMKLPADKKPKTVITSIALAVLIAAWGGTEYKENIDANVALAKAKKDVGIVQIIEQQDVIVTEIVDKDTVKKTVTIPEHKRSFYGVYQLPVLEQDSIEITATLKSNDSLLFFGKVVLDSSTFVLKYQGKTDKQTADSVEVK
jgi:hypothetical protein